MGGEKHTPTEASPRGKMDRAVLGGDEGETFVVVERDEVEVSGLPPTAPNDVNPQQHFTGATSTPAPFVPGAFEVIGASLSASLTSPATSSTPRDSTQQNVATTERGTSTGHEVVVTAAAPQPPQATAAEVVHEVVCAYAIVAYHEALWLAEKACEQAKAARRRWQARGPLHPTVKRVLDHKFFPVLLVVVLSLLVTLPAYWAMPSSRGGQRRLSSREWQAMYEDLSSKHSAETVRHRLKYDKLAGKHVELQAEFDAFLEELNKSQRSKTRGAASQSGSCFEQGVDGCQAKDESGGCGSDYLISPSTVAAAKEAFRVAEKSTYDMFRHFSDGLREDLHEIAQALRGGRGDCRGGAGGGGGGGGGKKGSPTDAYNGAGDNTDDTGKKASTAAATRKTPKNSKKMKKKVKKKDGKGKDKATPDEGDGVERQDDDDTVDVVPAFGSAVGRAVGLPSAREDLRDEAGRDVLTDGNAPKVGPVDGERRGADGSVFDVVLPDGNQGLATTGEDYGSSNELDREVSRNADTVQHEGEPGAGGGGLATPTKKKNKGIDRNTKKENRAKQNKGDGRMGGTHRVNHDEGVGRGHGGGGGGDQNVRVKKAKEIMRDNDGRRKPAAQGDRSVSAGARKLDNKEIVKQQRERSELDTSGRHRSHARHACHAPADDTVVISQGGEVVRPRTEAEIAGRRAREWDLSQGQCGEHGRDNKKKLKKDEKKGKRDKVAKEKGRASKGGAWRDGKKYIKKGLKREKKQLKREKKQLKKDKKAKAKNYKNKPKKEKGSKKGESGDRRRRRRS